MGQQMQEEIAVNYKEQLFVYGHIACFRILLLMFRLADLTLELYLKGLSTDMGSLVADVII